MDCFVDKLRCLNLRIFKKEKVNIKKNVLLIKIGLWKIGRGEKGKDKS